MTHVAFVIPAERDASARVFVWDEPAELLALLHAELAAETLTESAELASPYGPITLWTNAGALTGPHGGMSPNHRAQAIAAPLGYRGRLAGPVVVTGDRDSPAGDIRGLPRAHLLALAIAMDKIGQEIAKETVRHAIVVAIAAHDRDRIRVLLDEMFAIDRISGSAALLAVGVMAPDLLPDIEIDDDAGGE